MSDEELEQDDIEDVDDDDGEDHAVEDGDREEDDADGDDESVDAVASSKGKSKGKTKAAVEEDMPSMEARQADRDTLAKAMEEFLSRGGKVQEIDANVVADPPKKPDSKYGSRPI